MKNLTGASASFVAQRSLETGDELNEANLEEALQSAANRAEFLKARTDDMLSTGIKKIRVVASSTSLKALTGMLVGDVAVISPASGSTMGLYTFVTGAPPFADKTAWLYASNDATGYWVRDQLALVAFDNTDGLAKLDATKIVVPQRTIFLYRVNTNEVDLGENASWQDILTDSPTALLVGDKVSLTFSSSAKNNDVTNAVGIRIAVTNPASVTSDAGASQVTYDFYANNKRQHVGAQALFTASTAGNHTFRVQALLTPGGGPYNVIFGNPSLQAHVIRP